MSFYGNGTGFCVTVNHNGAGWSTPSDDFSRPGWLKAKCASGDTLEIRLGVCSALPDTYLYVQFLDLACEC